MSYDTVYQKDKKDCVFSKKIIEQLNSIVPNGVSDKEVDRVTYSKDYWPITLRWLLDGKLPALPDCIAWPEIAEKIAQKKVAELRKEAECIVTACPACSAAFEGDGNEVYDLSEIVTMSMKKKE